MLLKSHVFLYFYFHIIVNRKDTSDNLFFLSLKSCALQNIWSKWIIFQYSMTLKNIIHSDADIWSILCSCFILLFTSVGFWLIWSRVDLPVADYGIMGIWILLTLLYCCLFLHVVLFPLLFSHYKTGYNFDILTLYTKKLSLTHIHYNSTFVDILAFCSLIYWFCFSTYFLSVYVIIAKVNFNRQHIGGKFWQLADFFLGIY